LTYHAVTQKLWWVINLASVSVNGKTFKATGGIVDTGTSVLVGSTLLVDEIFKAANIPLNT